MVSVVDRNKGLASAPVNQVLLDDDPVCFTRRMCAHADHYACRVHIIQRALYSC
jgi:hypothetical protein